MWKPLCEFLDEFYEDQHDRTQMLADEPMADIARQEMAFLAASAEYLSAFYYLVAPDWIEKP